MVIETERLILRPFSDGDSEDVYEYLKEPAVNCFAGMKLNSLAEAREEMKKRAGDTEYYFAIVLKESGKVIGRIEYHFYGCMQDGCKMAYVDWVYVLPEFRHRGVARQLFKEFESDCKQNGIDQYYLIRAENPDADKFYHSFEKAELSRVPLLRKYLK